MYTNIMVPIDLAHESTVEKAINVAADLGKLYEASITLVGVTTSQPGSVAHNEQEFAEKLAEFAQSKSAAYGHDMGHKAVHSNDPVVDLDDALADTCEEMGVDLVVMASHVPGFMDHLFKSNASRLVTHTSISVFVIR